MRWLLMAHKRLKEQLSFVGIRKSSRTHRVLPDVTADCECSGSKNVSWKEIENYMKPKSKIITGTAIITSFAAMTVLAQETTVPKTDNSLPEHQWVGSANLEHLNCVVKSSTVIGMTVQNDQAEKLGTVKDLALDVTSGRIVEVILSTGGFLGLDATLNAVPPSLFHYDLTNKVLQLEVTQDKLKAAPRFDPSNQDDATQSNRLIEVYGYYNETPYFTSQYGYETTNAAGTLSRNGDGPFKTLNGRATAAEQYGQVANNTESTNEPEAMNVDRHYSRYNESYNSWSRMGYVQMASKLTGLPVNNLQNEKLGKVETFMVDLSAGRIVAVIVSSGGFLGMDGELSAIPASKLSFNDAHDAFQLDASKEKLAESPHFKGDAWPDFNQPGYAGTIYSAYHTEPYFSTNAMGGPNNTAWNVRDRANNTVTPFDQGNDQADINTTAQIRKQIMADPGMSMNAQNIKIVTLNGHVTLRGPVNTPDEKNRIGEIANQVAQSGNVDNQLEVVTTTTSNN